MTRQAGFRFCAWILLPTLAALVAAAPVAGAALTDAERATLERTAETHRHDEPVATPAATTPPKTAVSARELRFRSADGREVRGYFARPEGASEGLPGLIVIHEWWGLNDNIRAETRRLAAEGYAALAVDLYGGRSAAAPREAMTLMQDLMKDQAAAEQVLLGAYDYLENVEKAPRIGSIGWCMGGRWSLTTALLLPARLDAAVMYYGTPSKDEAALARLQMPILGLFAGEDPIIRAADVQAFEATLERLGKNAEIRIYEGARHGFANPSGTVYDAAAAEDAWRRTTRFLEAHLLQEPS